MTPSFILLGFLLMLDLSPIDVAIAMFFRQPTVDATRIFHGRGGLYPGLQWCVIDAFAPTVLVTVFSEPPPGALDQIQRQIQTWLPYDVFDRLAIQHRYLDSAPYSWVLGEPLTESFAQRGAHRFHLRYSRQNVGFFLDMEPGRRWLEQRAKGARVLNLFSYTCVFSVIAQAAGARSVVNVDMSKGALTTGRENHQLNQLATDTIQFMPLDILKSWSRIKKPGPYDIVIIDPPTFQKGSFVAEKDYGKVIARLPELVAAGGDVLACLNAPELNESFLHNLFTDKAGDFRFIERLSLPEVFRDVDSQRQLKLLHYLAIR
jgi:23S rRNA (cytosine1962-C5)-methyltransferase